MTAKCGTYAGWQRHNRNGEPPCEDCRHAQTDYMRDYRLRKGSGRQFNYPTEIRADLLDMPSVGARIAQSFREAS